MDVESGDDAIKRLEKSFIYDADAQQEDLVRMIERLQRFAHVDRNGMVIIEPNDREYTAISKVMLVLCARHLGNQLQIKAGKEPTIGQEVTADEVAEILHMQKTIVAARLVDLVNKDRWAIRSGTGRYRVAPYQINGFLKLLEI